MDRTGIIVVSICAVLLFYWFYEQQQQTARYQEQRRQFMLTNKVATAAAPVAPATPTVTTTTPVLFDTNAPEQLIARTNQHIRYTFTSRGGGLKTVELLGYTNSISRKNTGSASNSVATLNTGATVPILAVLGDTNLVGDGNFTLTATDYGVRAEKALPDGLRVTKEFFFSSNYLVNASVRFENTSGQAIHLPAQEFVIGTATPMDVDDSSFASYSGGMMWYDGSSPQSCLPGYFNTNTTAWWGLRSRTPTYEYRAGSNNVIWATAHNQYFAIVAMTKTNQPAEAVAARPVTQTPGAPVQAALVYPAQTLTANGNLERQLVLFAGPKEYRTLARVGDEFHNRADLAMNFGTGFASFWGIGSFFAKLLLAAMNALHDLIPAVSYGWIIVFITVLLRLVFWPLTAASMRSAKKMQALAPQVNALRDKYKDDPQKFTQKQWELWRKNKVSPMSGCLPMLIQMPVFIGFFTMIRSAIELRGAHFLWVGDLSKPDTLFVIPGLNFPVNLLPLLMVGAMVWQSHLQPPSPGMDPAQQKMMRYMPLIFLLFLYGYSSGMALYMTVSTLLGIVQMQLLRRQMAAAPAPAPVAPPSKGKK